MLNKELMKFVEDLFLESIDIESVLKNNKWFGRIFLKFWIICFKL